MISLSVDTGELTGVDLLGKSVDDLQENVHIGMNTITGTSKYVTDYTGFSGTVEEQSGNYIALHVASNVEGATLTAELVGGYSGPVELDEDGIIIFKLNDNATAVKVTAEKEGYADETKTYFLNVEKETA